MSAALLLQTLLTQACLPAYSAASTNSADTALETAKILEVDAELKEIRAADQSTDGQHVNNLRWRIARKVLSGLIQVQTMENRIESDVAYTYDWLSREERKVDKVNALFNLANFLQFGTLYTLEPYFRINKAFLAGKCLTCTGAGLGVALPVANIMYNKFHRLTRLEVPTILIGAIDNGPIGFGNMPLYVDRYMEMSNKDSFVSRKEELRALWKKLYGADGSDPESLGAVNAGKPKHLSVLNRRIVLLWSLFTAVQDFDEDLQVLLKEVDTSQSSPSDYDSDALAYLSPRAKEVANLLHLEPVIAGLERARAESASTSASDQMRLDFMIRMLSAYLDIHNSSHRCQQELNFQYDVVLAQLTSRRDKFLQKTYEANFIQNGAFGGIAGYSYLKGYPKNGNLMFILSNSTGIAITTVSLLASHGGWRKNSAPPNSLADFFDLKTPESYGFSELAWHYLNAKPTGDSLSRKERLQKDWKRLSSMNIDEPKVRAKLANMPSSKYDTIKLVNDRTALLSSLEQCFDNFDAELLALYQEVLRHNARIASSELPRFLHASNASAAADGQTSIEATTGRSVAEFFRGGADSTNKELMTYAVFEALLEQTVDANMISRQILREKEVLRRMERSRDRLIQLTNVANFYQIGILGVTYNSLGLSHFATNVLAGDRINIVSGYMVSGLAMLAFAERRGGFRPEKAEPNALAMPLSNQTQSVKLSPFVVHHLDSVTPYAPETRRNLLVSHWKNSRAFTVDVEKPQIKEKLSATKSNSKFWDESINLIRNRVFMLYDLRAVVRNSNTGLSNYL